MAGKLQNEDFKTEAELTGAGGSASQLLNDTKIYVTATGINKTLDDAITDGDIGAGSGATVEYASNSGMGDTDDTTSFVTSSNGSPIPATTYTGLRAKRCQFSTAVAATDQIFLEVKPNNSVDAWINLTGVFVDAGSSFNTAMKTASNINYGMCVGNVISSTQIDVYFERYQDNSNTNWSTSNTARWRLVKVSY